MGRDELFEKIEVFIVNIPSTIKKTLLWLIISYSIPMINVSIIWGMRKTIDLDLSIINIILVTNACFITSLLFLIDKTKRESTFVLNVITLLICSVLFSLGAVQMEFKREIFSIEIYAYGASMTLFLSIFIGLISKYDEVEALSKARAKKGKSTKKTTINDVEVDL